MSKMYQLPKAFALDWVKALRSEEYSQHSDALAFIEEDTEHCSYCCLGVGLAIVGEKAENMLGYETPNCLLIYNGEVEGFPIELLGEDNKLVDVLMFLNDGGTLTAINKYKKEGFKFRHEFKKEEDSTFYMRLVPYTFPQIADFIEDNVEFYEEKDS